MYVLEEVLLLGGVVPEEGYGVRHHPDVAAAEVVVGLSPLPVPGKEAVGINCMTKDDFCHRNSILDIDMDCCQYIT